MPARRRPAPRLLLCRCLRFVDVGPLGRRLLPRCLVPAWGLSRPPTVGRAVPVHTIGSHEAASVGVKTDGAGLLGRLWRSASAGSEYHRAQSLVLPRGRSRCLRGGGKAGHSGASEVLTSPMTTAELGVHRMSFCSPASPSKHPNIALCCYVALLLPHLPTFWFSSAMNAPPPGRFGSSCMAKGATRRWHRGALPERRPRRRRHRRRWQA